ncbi:uncharacterized protein UV8b_02787 [Ustilaginoidea virens]|uniref:DNA (cytosine-5)-methyltransferase 1 replication foci domain-containing protein n=1 Tax=Ustilaginoidea virens TaxID=1159556 RepID=A0A8E5MGF5_USTVR|nr:uncharacterized protein UV8b_02787 [Ustilaginoidea virens]QUC18546.1 hypothetical protein UV8b_02787 [Ustilaginoidea virens]
MSASRRRASTSSVETVDDSETRWRQESSVIRSVNKELPSDDWPIFELQNAIVLDKDGKNIENALLTGVRGPFIIRGHLVIDDPSQKSYLIMRVRSSAPVEIRKSALYSIGESPDGRPLIWVSGQGGWYELDPCPEYQPMYNKMCEATTLFYNILDIYNQDPPRKPKKCKNYTPMDELLHVFHKYASRIGDGSTIEEVIARAREHVDFFQDKFSHNDDPIVWSSTAFHKWITGDPVVMERQMNEALERIRRQPYVPTGVAGRLPRRVKSDIVGVTKPQRNAKPKITSLAHGTDKQTISASLRTPLSADGRHHIVPHYEWTEKDNLPNSPFHAAFATFEDCFRALGQTKRGLTLSGALGYLYFNYSMPNYRTGEPGSYKQPAREWLHYYSRAFLHMYKGRKEAKRHSLFGELQSMAEEDFIPIAYKARDFPVIFTNRKSQPRKASAQVPSTPAPRDGGSSATDVPKPMGKRPTRTPGKSSLRPISRATKKRRLHDELESDYAISDSPGNKRPRNHGEDDSFNNMDADGDVDAEDGPELGSPGEDEAGEKTGGKHPGSQCNIEPIKLVIRAERLPETSPRGPHDTWTCDQEGCDYIVRGGDEDECQARIRQHFRDHEQQLARVNLAVTEGSRGHLPIHHLLEKIKQMRRKSSLPSQTHHEVQPIKRKLIV